MASNGVHPSCLAGLVMSCNTIRPPLMFWIYGGGLNGGTIFDFKYNGSYLAAHDVVLVSVNYRVGKLGFLYGGNGSTAPGNVGLYDQVMALKWVRENIHTFGGDRDQITVFGESAGSRSISALIVSPETKGLFRRAIMESGANLHYKGRQQHTTDEALNASQTIAKALNCSENFDDNQWLDCLRERDAKEFSKFSESTFPLEGTDFLPISIIQAFADSKYMQDLDIMAGVNRNEGSKLAYGAFPQLHSNITDKDFDDLVVAINSSYHGLKLPNLRQFYLKDDHKNHSSDVLRQAFYDLFGDVGIKCPTYLTAKQYANYAIKSGSKSGVYMYELTYQSQFAKILGCGENMGICHESDVEFVFGLPLWVDKLYPKTHTQLDVDFSLYVMKLWTDFAKYGKPDDQWPHILDDKNNIKIKDLNPTNTSRPIHIRILEYTYAEPPVGALRFNKPLPLKKPIKHIIDGTKPGNSCLQTPYDLKLQQSEDCLVLNIWTPNVDKPLKPVMFWIYGGSLNEGSIFKLLYNGSYLAAHDVLVVSANYRLGRLGFLYGGNGSTAPGNVGLYDQVMALKWVRENIHSFGGDRDQITVFGESAGSESISALIVSPETKGLF
ncbi:unnamed protein product, partial [Oppiella nova]